MLFLKIFSDKDKELGLIQDDYISPIPKELHWDEWAGDDEGMTGDELLKFVNQKLFPALANIDLSTGNRRALLVSEVFANNYNYMKSGIHLRQVINKLNEIDFNNSNIHALPGTTNHERKGQHIVLSYKRKTGVRTDL
jgi:type I restriction enzyme M protein